MREEEKVAVRRHDAMAMPCHFRPKIREGWYGGGERRAAEVQWPGRQAWCW